ncbi:hypothetical protein GGR56DRAFT_517380 [Xylariaceae sp. FL0804]|nr:hypothetical protein GGR56DRAFT_517380 [Xylariaceae sp. FL0804]
MMGRPAAMAAPTAVVLNNKLSKTITRASHGNTPRSAVTPRSHTGRPCRASPGGCGLSGMLIIPDPVQPFGAKRLTRSCLSQPRSWSRRNDIPAHHLTGQLGITKSIVPLQLGRPFSSSSPKCLERMAYVEELRWRDGDDYRRRHHHHHHHRHHDHHKPAAQVIENFGRLVIDDNSRLHPGRGPAVIYNQPGATVLMQPQQRCDKRHHHHHHQPTSSPYYYNYYYPEYYNSSPPCLDYRDPYYSNNNYNYNYSNGRHHYYPRYADDYYSRYNNNSLLPCRRCRTLCVGVGGLCRACYAAVTATPPRRPAALPGRRPNYLLP